MQLEGLIDKEFAQRQGVSPVLLNEVQAKNGMFLPSDLVFLLLNSDGLKFKHSYEISLDKKEPIVEIGDILNLEWLVKEREYDTQDDSRVNYTDEYLKIANTFSQDIVLIGTSRNNLNQIFLYSYAEDELIKICDSLFVFLNEHLILMDE
jgi:hypothetical protein